MGHRDAPAGERGITPSVEATGDGRCVGARTERAWLCDYPCERRTGNLTKPSIRPCGSGRRRPPLSMEKGDSRPVRHTAGAYPRLKMQAPIVPAPDDPRRLQRSLPTSTGRQAGEENEALSASAPDAGEHITDMAPNVNAIRLPQKPPSPRIRCGAPLPSGATAPQGSGAPCQARGDGRKGWETDIRLFLEVRRNA